MKEKGHRESSISEKSNAIWGGRFREALHPEALRFSTSIHQDKHLYAFDIEGSIAHIAGLLDAGILTPEEQAAIVSALKEIKEEIASGVLILDDRYEDVHMAIEQRLTEKIGALGGKLHTGRSRNDQVALDERLYIRDAVQQLVEEVVALQRALLAKAEETFGLIMPGFTHTQHAQPVLFSHHLLAYIHMLERDRERLVDANARQDRSPLGAAAFAGTSYPIDRTIAQKQLGFGSIVANSIDAVSDRDHLLEVISACSIGMMHLSRMAEEIVMWSTTEFNFITLGDAVTTGSSIMPNKKNPDLAELVRGKTGKAYGALVNLLVTMKGLPLSYNRDMQEDKQPLFDAVDTFRDSLRMMTLMWERCTVNEQAITAQLKKDYSTATEIADHLARNGTPFREAHHVAGEIVGYASAKNIGLSELTVEDLQKISPLLDAEVLPLLQPEESIRLKKTSGSTAPIEVERELLAWKERLQP